MGIDTDKQTPDADTPASASLPRRPCTRNHGEGRSVVRSWPHTKWYVYTDGAHHAEGPLTSGMDRAVPLASIPPTANKSPMRLFVCWSAEKHKHTQVHTHTHTRCVHMLSSSSPTSLPLQARSANDVRPSPRAQIELTLIRGTPLWHVRRHVRRTSQRMRQRDSGVALDCVQSLLLDFCGVRD